MRFLAPSAAVGLLSACGTAILIVLLWMFFSAQPPRTPFNVPPTLLGWLLLVIPSLAASAGFVLTYMSLLEEERRAEQNQAFADRHQFIYERRISDIAWPERIRTEVGPHSATLSHHCRGTFAGLPVNVFDVEYTVVTGGGEHETHTRHQHTVVIWHVPEANFPPFTLRHRELESIPIVGPFKQLSALVAASVEPAMSFDAQAVAGRDREAIQDFNARYRAYADTSNPAVDLAIRKLLVPDVMRELLVAGSFCMVATPAAIAMWRVDNVCTGEERDQLLRDFQRLLKIFSVATLQHDEVKVIPADPQQPAWDRPPWPLIPGIAAAMFGSTGFAVSGFVLLGLLVVRKGDLPAWVLPAGIAGSVIVCAAVGWLIGTFYALKVQRNREESKHR